MIFFKIDAKVNSLSNKEVDRAMSKITSEKLQKEFYRSRSTQNTICNTFSSSTISNNSIQLLFIRLRNLQTCNFCRSTYLCSTTKLAQPWFFTYNNSYSWTSKTKWYLKEMSWLIKILIHKPCIYGYPIKYIQWESSSIHEEWTRFNHQSLGPKLLPYIIRSLPCTKHCLSQNLYKILSHVTSNEKCW